jgi:spoIIIJ-associated protein
MEASTTSAAARVRELLQRIAEDVGVDAEVRITENDEGVTAEYLGDDLGLLIGHHGQTIDAIQHIAYRVAFKGASDRKGVTVDVHEHLKGRHDVETYSEGQEPDRRLVVAPLVN